MPDRNERNRRCRLPGEVEVKEVLAQNAHDLGQVSGIANIIQNKRPIAVRGHRFQPGNDGVRPPNKCQRRQRLAQKGDDSGGIAAAHRPDAGLRRRPWMPGQIGQLIGIAVQADDGARRGVNEAVQRGREDGIAALRNFGRIGFVGGAGDDNHGASPMPPMNSLAPPDAVSSSP